MAQKQKDYASLKPKSLLENPNDISKSIFTPNKIMSDNLPVFKRKSINETKIIVSKKIKVIEYSGSNNNSSSSSKLDSNDKSESELIVPTESSKPESKVISGMFDYNSDSD
jgi:hypothetical protein